MRFTVDIWTGNAALNGEDAADELARILRRLADEAELGAPRNGSEIRPLLDVNGNRVGTWAWDPETDDDDDPDDDDDRGDINADHDA